MSAGQRIPIGGSIILDSGAVLAFVQGRRETRLTCQGAVGAGFSVILPTAVYAQVERGGRRAPIERQYTRLLLEICEVAPLTIDIAQQAGWLLGDSETTDVVDAVVVVEALNRDHALILTSDPGDIHHLSTFGANRARRGVRVARP